MTTVKRGKKLKIYEIVSVGIFAALMVVFSQISVPMPFSPVPLTLSLFAVYLSSAVLGLKLGVLVQAVYLLLGIAGFPVFSGFNGGFGHLFGPTGGYLLSYPVMAALIGSFSDRIPISRFKTPAAGKKSFLLMLSYTIVFTVALAVCYLLGSLRLSYVLSIPLSAGLLAGALPYIPLDILKIAICTLIVLPVKRRYLSIAAIPRPADRTGEV